MKIVLMFCLSVGALMGAAAEAAEADIDALRAQAAVLAQGEGRAVAGSAADWLFLRSEMRHLSHPCFWGEAALTTAVASKDDNKDPLPSIIHFKESLAAGGIELLLVPVPPKAAIYADKAFGIAAPSLPIAFAYREFYRELNQHGVRILDLSEDLIAARASDDTDGPVYCRTDAHWSPRGIRIAAQRIAHELALESGSNNYTVAPTSLDFLGDLREEGDAHEILPALRVTGTAEAEVSPVLVLGDSHTLIFSIGGDMHASSCGVIDLLAAELKQPVSLIGKKGSGSSATRIALYQKARKSPEYLAGRKVVVWLFSAREFSESSSGWVQLPWKLAP